MLLYSMSDITFRLTGGTNVGLVRTNNEDNFIVNADLTHDEWFIPSDMSNDIKLGEAGCLFVVADGMGGMNAGEVASAIAVDSVKDSFNNADLKKITGSENKMRDFMHKTIKIADKNIKKRVAEDSSTQGMGTTIVIGWVYNDKVHISWCGDSRAYLFNAKSGMKRLSKDHSYVQQLVDEGKLDAELAFDHPNSNIITRCLGDSMTEAQPDYTSSPIVEGDMIILCSDGLCGLCRDEEIIDILNRYGDDIEQCKAELISGALNAGGYDNVTVTIFQTKSIEHSDSDTIDISNTSSDFGKKRDLRLYAKLYKKAIAFLVVVVIILAVWLYFKTNNTESFTTAIDSVKNIFNTSR